MPSSHLQYLPIPWPVYVFLLGALAIIAALVQIGLIRYVYARLGISPLAALLLLLASLFGAYINIPIAQLPGETSVVGQRVDFFGFEYVVPTEVDWPGTIIAINVGGAVIPIALSIYLLLKNNIWLPAIIATAVVSAVCYAVAEPVRGAGIAIPIFIPPLVACAVSCVVGLEPGCTRRLCERQPWDSDRRGSHELSGHPQPWHTRRLDRRCGDFRRHIRDRNCRSRAGEPHRLNWRPQSPSGPRLMREFQSKAGRTRFGRRLAGRPCAFLKPAPWDSTFRSAFPCASWYPIFYHGHLPRRADARVRPRTR